SNPAVASVSNATGRWQVTVNTAGTTTITAAQAGSTTYLAAASVGQLLTVQAAPTTAVKIPIDPQRWYQPTNSPDGIAALFDGVTSVDVTAGYG
nr:hypothetical protein [Tanacetum cinerariifolium]